MKNHRCTASLRTVVALLVLPLLSVAFASAFFLPPGEGSNSGDPHLKIDATGNLHMVYSMIASQGLTYAWCQAGCPDESAVRTVSFDTSDLGTVGTSLIAVSTSGRPHILAETMDSLLYAECLGDCTQVSGWHMTIISQDHMDWSLNGKAFTLDHQDRPRFLTHGEIGYLNLFSAEEGTRLWTCDLNCLDPASWSHTVVSEQNWVEATLLYDRSGVAHVAAIIPVEDADLVAYLRCDTDCSNPVVDNWPGIGLGNAFSDLYIEEVNYAVAMDVTSGGGVRLAFLGADGENRNLIYFACEQECTKEDASGWNGLFLLDGELAEGLGDGIDLVLDAQDRPRVVYTFRQNIVMTHCDSSDCLGLSGESGWELNILEDSSDIPADDIFLYHNCNVGMWFLRQPSIAIAPSGLPVLAYRAEDVSAGWVTADPLKPACVAGVDMTMARLNQPASY